MTMLDWIMTGLAVGMALVLVAFARLVWQRISEFVALARPSPAVDLPPNSPRISVIVPARNEQANIEACLRALLDQDYPDFEVIAVDDNSTDSTPEILARLAQEYDHLRPISAPPLPAGWMGKCHALWTGAQQATGSWLLFVDADTFAQPGLLRGALVYLLQHNLTMLSPIPGQDLDSVAERIIQPVVFAMLQIFLPPGRANDPNDPLGHVSGQCLAIRTKEYFAMGGHSHPIVRPAISEDTALGQVFKDLKYPYHVVDGRLIVRTHMYTNFQEIWQGWAKNFFPGLRERGWLIPFSLASNAIVVTYFSVVFFVPQPNWLIWVNLSLLLGFVVVSTGLRAVVARYLEQSLAWVLTWPLGLMIVGGISFTSWLRSATQRGSVWKGRRY